MNDEFLLVVDDEPLLLETCRFVLEDAGFGVMGVRSAEEAERVLLDSGRLVKALITDVSLGAGKRSGWTLAERAREMRDDLPVIYLSGTGAGDVDSNGVPGCAFLPKPFLPKQLVELVRRLAA